MEAKAVRDTFERGKKVDALSIEEQQALAKKLLLQLVGYNK